MNQTMVDRINEINRKMLADTFDKVSGERNIVFSSLSLVLVLSLAMDGAHGETASQIRNFLLESYSEDEIDKLISEIRSKLTYGPFLKTANSLVTSEEVGAQIKPEYIQLIRDRHDAECIYAPNAELINKVNSWVNKKTKGMIPQILDESISDANLYLINAVIFEAKWETPYEDEDIIDDKTEQFISFNGEQERAVFLKSIEDLYLEDENCTGFLKPYKGGKYSFAGFLPKGKKKSDLSKLIDSLDISTLIENAACKDVHARIPEFEINDSYEMSSFCIENGLTKMFDQTEADFSGITDLSPTFVKSILQKAYIKVDRYGTKAAAATTLMFCAAGIPNHDNTKFVYLNRPFVYAIIDNETKLPVFSGVMVHLK